MINSADTPPALAIASVNEFAARHLPLARATSLESWSDLSGAPTCAPDFLCARAMRVRMVATLGGVTLALQKA